MKKRQLKKKKKILVVDFTNVSSKELIEPFLEGKTYCEEPFIPLYISYIHCKKIYKKGKRYKK